MPSPLTTPTPPTQDQDPSRLRCPNEHRLKMLTLNPDFNSATSGLLMSVNKLVTGWVFIRAEGSGLVQV